METIEVPVEGGKLVAWRSGSGRPALLLHGGPGAGDSHEGLADELDGLYETVRYQQRGLPPSDAPGPYSIEIFVADLVAVLDALEWERATLIGHSWGGLLAQHATAARPDRVEAMIGLCTLGAVGPDGGWSQLDGALDKRLPADVSEKVAALDKKLYEGKGSDEDALEMLRICWPFYFADPSLAPEMPEAPMNSDVYAQVHASAIEHYKKGTLESLLPSFERKVLFIQADSDVIPSEPARATAEMLPNADFVLLEKSGHFPWMERPGAVRSAIEAWTA